LTDYLLAVVSMLCLRQLLRIEPGRRPYGAILFFAGFGAAAVCGGTWHGFFSDAVGTPGLLWWLTLVCTGIAASGLAVIGIERLGWRDPHRLLIGSAALVAAFAAYVYWDRRFLVGVIASSIATLLCVAGLARHALHRPRTGAGLAIGGLALSVTGAILQQSGVAIQPVHFDHNATYHLWLLAALWPFHVGNLRIARSDSGGA